MPNYEYDAAYISVDIETAGPNPSQFSLLSIGACSVVHPENTFYIELQPEIDEMQPESFTIHQLSLEELKSRGLPAREAMVRFEGWLQEVVPPGEKPVFVAFNAPFDWMFVNDYFHRYIGYNPFGHSALDMKAFYMALHGSSWVETAMSYVAGRYLNGKQISHNALEDACDQAKIFSGMYQQAMNRD
jgi:DNA polymerase III epsilon subunit-like protein